MVPRFLGRFLIEEGEIDARQLRDATDLMFWANRALGEIALKCGYMTGSDMERILHAQERSDALFGDLAIEMGVLTRRHVDDLMDRQRSRHMRLGDALVELGFSTRERIAELAQRFEEEQRAFLPENRQLPPELASRPLVGFLLAALPRLSLRSAAVGLKLGLARPWSGASPNPWRGGLSIRGETELDVGVSFDSGTLQMLTRGRRGDLRRTVTPEESEAAFAHFLEQIAEAVSTAPEAEGCQVTDVRQRSLPEAGFAFDLVSVSGRGLLVVAPV